jgi:uncharacterized protein (DUF58 family)
VPPPAARDEGAVLPREVVAQVRRLEIRTRRLVQDLFQGEYHSVFRGRGMEFDEVRPYVPGDDVRAIDWNVTARTGEPYVKRFVEERELTVSFMVDLSGSTDFGLTRRTKGQMAAEIAAVLAMSAARNKDKIGMIPFTDRVEAYIPPRKGRAHVLRVIREILFFRPTGRGTRITAALEFAARVHRRRAVIFLISDFRDADFERGLLVLSRRHDVVAIRVSDAFERALRGAGVVELLDPETGERVLCDLSDSRLARSYAGHRRDRDLRLEEIFRRTGVDMIDVETGGDYVAPLRSFFAARERRRR